MGSNPTPEVNQQSGFSQQNVQTAYLRTIGTRDKTPSSISVSAVAETAGLILGPNGDRMMLYVLERQHLVFADNSKW